MGIHCLASHNMKLLVALSALLSLCLAADEAKVVSYSGYPYSAYHYAAYPNTYTGYPYGYAASAVAAPAPFVAPASIAASAVAAPVASYSAYAPYAPYTAGSQFHAQDEFGNLNYGYTNLNSVKQEVGNTYGGVSGGYSYVDANGELQQVQYIADGAGFRVADSRLPVAPVYDGVAPTFNPEPLVAPTFNPVLPVAPVDTPEVAEAKAAHLAAVAAAAPAERKRREAAFSYGFGTAHPTYAYGYAGLPHAAGLPYAAGLPHAGLGYAGLGYGLPYHG